MANNFLFRSYFTRRKLQFIDNVYEQTRSLCQNNEKFLMPLCQSSTKLLNHLISNLHKSENDLKNLIFKPIVKRAWFNIIGSAFKTVFGTLDKNDAEYYNEIINRVNKNNHQFTELLKQQITVVNFTIINFNNSIINLNKNVMIFKKNLKQISNYSRRLNNRYLALELKQNFDEHFSLLNLIILTLQNKITIIMDTILLAKSNTLHPIVITPTQLIKKMSKTIPFLPSSTTYPLPLKQENAHKYLEILKIKCFFSKNKIGYILSIPLVNHKQFVLYKLTSLYLFLIITLDIINSSCHQLAIYQFQKIVTCIHH